ncbi:MAG: hypothetical protein A3I89_03785 [Candidatus Harrisonbacteria bacterium RIFCSPLOWO2_02_FULL_41_11]|uniref:Uncharacterized protein n=1 Tax=Candidatus Harrisonbacteria bacterium RIFCSPHIGHO2_02_FULL_42_16 TaxID=1798404 RepID=A0A1G1ZH37_9BACT|nr:MAG: hypothetical protein A3B92_01550 [Candidatus Harrisonbacteria bacterium RIFCSPHIGHO2_02_FULL_42_16]OGY66184.1 MAG: hypothetical protein A3I89_03785 [Candidatus Harrisonbacteria bacterium RIFCSPLOWO2_02_FULL_41_11]
MSNAELFYLLTAVLYALSIIASVFFIWWFVEKSKKIYWNYKMAKMLYGAWKDAYSAGYLLDERPGAPVEYFYSKFTDELFQEILRNGYIEGHEDSKYNRSNKVYCYGMFGEKYPPAWEYVQRLVEKRLDEKFQ